MRKKDMEIVVIEDENDILELIEYHLEKEGYQTIGFHSTENVEQFLEEEDPVLMIVDRNLPGMEGSEFVAHLREQGYTIPVIFLTAKDRDYELEEGFKRGGDDYINKPFKVKELLLRIEALLKRSGVHKNSTIKYRDLHMDIARHELTIDHQVIDLTNLEFQLLYTFIKNPHQPLDRDYLRDEVWGDDSSKFNDKTINVAMNRLKKKIDPDGSKAYISPVWGVGYKLN
jgi:DNA-binding response OmpR family regulator